MDVGQMMRREGFSMAKSGNSNPGSNHLLSGSAWKLYFSSKFRLLQNNKYFLLLLAFASGEIVGLLSLGTLSGAPPSLSGLANPELQMLISAAAKGPEYG